MSSELSLESKPLNLLSARRLPNDDFLSVDGELAVVVVAVVVGGAVEPSEKAPNAPIGEKLALCDTDCQGGDGPVRPALKGFVVLRLRLPKGDGMDSEPASRAEASLSLSSGLTKEEEEDSRTSVFRRRRAGGGVEVVGSSRKKREAAPVAVGDKALPATSLVSRRLALGRPVIGEEALKAWLEYETDSLRPGPAESFALDGGGLRGEFTEVENSCNC